MTKCITIHSARRTLTNWRIASVVYPSGPTEPNRHKIKRGFFRATNAIFGKIGRAVSEEVVLELVKCKCLPILLYGLECCPLNKTDVKSLDFAVTRFLMKLFRSVNLDLINECRFWFNFSLPSELLCEVLLLDMLWA